MGSNFIDGYMHNILYINLMVTTNQKLLIDTQKIKRKKSKYITKDRTLCEKRARGKIKRKNSKYITKGSRAL